MSDLLVLCYHAVSEDWPANLAIAPGRLEEQLAGLVERGYQGATFTEAVTAAPPARTLVVTFDDAYRSVLELAVPILARLELPGTVFAPTRFIDGGEPITWDGVDQWLGGPHESELLPMDAEQLRTLAAAGWEIGAHSHSHPHLPRLGDAELAQELRESKQRLEQAIEAPCRSLAYPYGDVDQRVALAAAEAGYVAGGALAGYELRGDRLRWPRILVNREDPPWRFSLKVSRVARRVRLARLRYAVRSAFGGSGD